MKSPYYVELSVHSINLLVRISKFPRTEGEYDRIAEESVLNISDLSNEQH